MTSLVPLSGELSLWTFGINGQQNSTSLPSALYYEVDPDYLHAMGIPLIQGRNFTESDNASSPHVCIINDFFARTMFPGRDPIGQHIQIGNNYSISREVVGVVGSVKQAGLDDKETYKSMKRMPNCPDRVQPSSCKPPANQWRCSRPCATPSSKLIRRNQWPSRARWTGGQRSRGAAAISHAAAGAIRGAGRRSSACGLYGVMSYTVTNKRRRSASVCSGSAATEHLRLIVLRGMALVGIGVATGLVAVAGDDPVAGGISVWSHATRPSHARERDLTFCGCGRYRLLDTGAARQPSGSAGGAAARVIVSRETIYLAPGSIVCLPAFESIK